MDRDPAWLGVILLGAALACAAATTARAQGTPSRVDVWAGVGAASAGTGTVTTAYVPQLAFATLERGSVGQAVTIDPAVRVASTFGIDVFLTKAVGVEAWIAHDTLGPFGRSGPYERSIRYVSHPPPSYDAVVVDYTRSDAWGTVTTDVHRWTTALDGVVRWGAGRRVGGTVSGGLAWVRTSGEVTPLGYSRFALGGHSALFSNEYRLTLAVLPTTVLRGNVGTTLDVVIARHAALSFGVRQVFGAEATSGLRVVAVDRSDATLDPPANDDITSQLARSSVSVPTAATRAVIGLRLRF